MNQILLGASIPFAIAFAWYGRRGFRASLRMLALVPLWMLLGALWAIVPDLPRLFGFYGLYARLAGDPRTNIFFWHHTIDRIETDSPLYHVGLMTIGLLLIVAAWRELRRAEER